MSSAEPLQTYTYPATTPNGLLRKLATRVVNELRLLRAVKFPSYVPLRNRPAHFVKGTELDIQHFCNQL